MISPLERHSVHAFIPWLLGMLNLERAMMEGDSDIDPQYYNGFVDCIETLKSYTARYLRKKGWAEVEMDVSRFLKSLNGRKRMETEQRELMGVLL